jgi:hypothetical protein
VAQEVENLPSKYKALNSIPSTERKEGRQEGRKQGRKEGGKKGQCQCNGAPMTSFTHSNSRIHPSGDQPPAVFREANTPSAHQVFTLTVATL